MKGRRRGAADWVELGIREIARRDAAVARVAARADAIRLRVSSDVYAARFGLSQDAAADLAMVEYATFSGLVLLDPDMPPARQRALAARYDRLVRTALSAGSPTDGGEA